MGDPVVHFEIASRDAAQLQEFYRRLFDWTIDTGAIRNYGRVKTGGQGGIEGGIFDTEGKMPSYLTVYVQVADLEASLRKAESLGGKRVVPPTAIPGTGSFAMFADPDGNLVGLFNRQE